MQSNPNISSRRSQAGFTLVELMVALTIFAIIALAAYAIYEAGRTSFKRGSEAADTQQRTRIGFDRMISDIRLAGFEYNRDGDQTPYQDQTDEQLEYLGATALVLRANFDAENNQDGREFDPDDGPPDEDTDVSGYETSASYLAENPDAFGFPIVTTGNDEIVLYALTKEGVNDSITLKLDVSKPRNADKRGLTDDEVPDNEETFEICGLALTHDDPPYTLERITLRDANISAGGGCIGENNLIRTPLADDIRSLNFEYFDSRDREYFCLATQSDGSCAEADQIPFLDVGGVDDASGGAKELSGRLARRQVRRVAVELVGMTESPDFEYTDPEEDDLGSQAAKHRKTRLLADLNPPNLGKVGQLDLNSVDPTRVKGVTACSGQCGFLRVTWQQNPREEQILGYVVNVFEIECGTTNILNKVTTKFVTGKSAYNRAGFLYTTFNAGDEVSLLEEARKEVGSRSCLAVQVTAKNVNGEDGPPSDFDDNEENGDQPTPLNNEDGTDEDGNAYPDEKLYDETRPDPVRNAWATGVSQSEQDSDGDGVPDDNDVSPETSSSSAAYPEANQITLEWETPGFVLDQDGDDNVTDNASAALGKIGPVGCFVEEDPAGNQRTPLEEVNGYSDTAQTLKALGSAIPEDQTRGRFLIFRSTEPNFAPRDHHLIAAVDDPTFVDRTVHHYRQDGQTLAFQYTDAFPVENCVEYYYRIRLADDCWDGTKPAGNDPANGDFNHRNLSPFYPPINPADEADTDTLSGGSTPGAAIVGYARPLGSGTNEDGSPEIVGRPEKVRNLRLDAYEDTNPPRFFLSFDLPKTVYPVQNTPDAGLQENHIAVGAVRVYGHKTNDDFDVPNPSPGPGCNNPPCSVSGGNTWYFGTVEPHTSPAGGRVVYKDDAQASPITGKEAGIRRYTIGHHDEDGDDTGSNTPPASWNVELPVEDESAVDLGGDGGANDAGDTGLRFEFPSNDSSPQWYIKVVGVQCKDAPSAFTNQGEDQGEPSDFIQVPCDFGQAVNGNASDGTGGTRSDQCKTCESGCANPFDCDPAHEISFSSADAAGDGSGCPGQLPTQINVSVTDPDDGNIRACQARLVLTSGVTGDVVSSDWRFWAPDAATCAEAEDAACPEGSSFHSTNEFCWTTEEVRQLTSRLRGQDIQVSVEMRESIPRTTCLGADRTDSDCLTVWQLPCVARKDCPSIVGADQCILAREVRRGDAPVVTTFNPLLQNDDFTGGVDPISGEPNGLPDGINDCYQAAHWTFEEACANGPLDVEEIRIRWRSEPGGACAGDLTQAFWNWDEVNDTGLRLFRSAGWPEEGHQGGNSVTVCDSDQGCANVVSCPDEICDDDIDNDGDGSRDCQDIDCRGHAACEDCDNNVDDDGDGLIDCADNDCAGDIACGGEDCTNVDGSGVPIDDDNDGRANCADSDCVGHASCGGSLACLFLDEGRDLKMRFEFDQAPDNNGDPTCPESAKNAEIEVEIDYTRIDLGGSSSAITQTFSFSPTAEPIPDLCNLCDQDNDGVEAQTGQDEDGDCAGGDCNDLDPSVGLPAAGGSCCDLDGDGYERLGETPTGDICGDPSLATCGNNVNDCNDDNAEVNPGGSEPQNSDDPLCSDGLDNDCDCSVDGLPVDTSEFECLF